VIENAALVIWAAFHAYGVLIYMVLVITFFLVFPTFRINGVFIYDL
jgi:hypothetical protein